MKRRKALRALARTPVNSGAIYVPPAVADWALGKGYALRAKNVPTFVGEIPVFLTDAGRAEIGAAEVPEVRCMCGAVNPRMVDIGDGLPRCETCGCH